MAFREVNNADAEKSISLGGFNKTTKKDNPTSVTGYYLGFKDIASKKSPSGKSKLHIFQTKDGNLGVWGKTDLDRKLETVTNGTMVRASYKGTITTKNGNTMYEFKVEIDEDNTIEVAASEEVEGDDGYEDEEEDRLPDEVPPVRASAPKQVTPPPSASAQAKTKELLAKGRAART